MLTISRPREKIRGDFRSGAKTAASGVHSGSANTNRSLPFSIPGETVASDVHSGSANTNRLLPLLGRSSDVSCRKLAVATAGPVPTATYCRPSTA